jgi:PIN domain nuclease of toxin-antitoxin system
MKQLLDTHTFLWFVAGKQELSETAKTQILIPEAKNFVSIASLWEISIKVKLGKLQINGTLPSIIGDLTENNFELLPINFAHIVKNFDLDFYHRDPFDRIIIAQALVEKMLLISKDNNFKHYNVKQVW